MIPEELRARDASLLGCPLSASYMKQVYEVREGGQRRVRNMRPCFLPLHPKTMCMSRRLGCGP